MEYHYWITADDYETFRSIIGHDPDFPNTFDAWFKEASNIVEQAKAQGQIIDIVTVYPDEFTAYCRASGIDPNVTTLSVFAVYKRNKR